MLWCSCGAAVSMGEAAQPLIFEGVQTSSYAVLCVTVSFCVAGAVLGPDPLYVEYHLRGRRNFSDALHFTLYTPHSNYAPHFLHFTLSTHLYTFHSTLYTLHSTLCTPHFALHTLHFTLRTLHSTLYTLHSTLCLHYTLHTLHCTL